MSLPVRLTLVAAAVAASGTLVALAQGRAATSASAPASAFGLQISPRGEQNLNLATGATELPQGGTVRDSGGQFTLVADSISLVPGKSLSASGVTLTNRLGGVLRAQHLTYLPKAALLTGSGTLSYSDNRFKNLSADTFYLDTRSGVVTAVGAVTASSPAISAAQAVVLPTKSNMLLLSAQLVNVLGQKVSGDQLLLNLVTGQTQSPVSAAALAPYQPYLR